MHKEKTQFREWISSPGVKQNIQTSIITLATAIILTLYQFVKADFIFNDINWGEVVIEVVVVNSSLWILRFGFILHANYDYSQTKDVLEQKRFIALAIKSVTKNKLSRKIQEFINKKNEERKTNAYQRSITIDIIKLEKEIDELIIKNEKKYSKKIAQIKKRIDKLYKEQDKLTDGKIDLKKVPIKYNAITKSNLYAGATLEGEGEDIELGYSLIGNSVNHYAKTSTFTILATLAVAAYNILFTDGADWGKVIIYILLMLLTILTTYSGTRVRGILKDLPRLIERRSLLEEFLEKEDVTIEEETKKTT